MPFGIIDNKKVDLTDDEWRMYQKIVKSYTTLTNKGEELFMDLFEVDDNGIILFLKPPSVRQTSFEVYFFLSSVFQHQHLRIMYGQVKDICQQMKNKIEEVNKLKEEMEALKQQLCVK